MNIVLKLGMGMMIAAGLCLTAAPASATTGYNGTDICPKIGNLTDTMCNIVITYNNDGSISSVTNNSNPYEGQEDMLIGVVNLTGGPIASSFLTGSASPAIFNFENDGVQHYSGGSIDNPFGCSPAATLGTDGTGYGGLTSGCEVTTFTGVSVDQQSGTATYGASGIPSNGAAYFSIEGPAGLTFSVDQPLPEPVSLLLFGTGVAGLAAARRRRSIR